MTLRIGILGLDAEGRAEEDCFSALQFVGELLQAQKGANRVESSGIRSSRLLDAQCLLEWARQEVAEHAQSSTAEDGVLQLDQAVVREEYCLVIHVLEEAIGRTGRATESAGMISAGDLAPDHVRWIALLPLCFRVLECRACANPEHPNTSLSCAGASDTALRLLGIKWNIGVCVGDLRLTEQTISFLNVMRFHTVHSTLV